MSAVAPLTRAEVDGWLALDIQGTGRAAVETLAVRALATIVHLRAVHDGAKNARGSAKAVARDRERALEERTQAAEAKLAVLTNAAERFLWLDGAGDEGAPEARLVLAMTVKMSPRVPAPDATPTEPQEEPVST